MKLLLVLAALLAVGWTKSVAVLKSSEIPEELIKNSRYLLFEREDGLFEVEDLQAEVPTAPLTISDNDVTFYVYTLENRNGVQIRGSQIGDFARLTGFNTRRDTVVIIHGWRNNFQSPVNAQIRNALLSSGRTVNVVVVDWSPIAAQSYLRAQGSVLSVGNYVGDFLVILNNNLGYSLNRFTLVGHSLGAHVAGNAGARARGSVSTIVGLDPAGPLFSSSNTNNRLDPTDAQYVHVVHTNDGLLGYGIRMGHSDYYPNGGASQPGCGIDLAGSCAHSRAYFYYAESINDNRFVARICASYELFQRQECSRNFASRLGFWPVTITNGGSYFLTTNNASPFARG